MATAKKKRLMDKDMRYDSFTKNSIARSHYWDALDAIHKDIHVRRL